MKLKDCVTIYSGFLSRGKILTKANGSHRLIQARNVKSGIIDCSEHSLSYFDPELSSRDTPLQDNDILFMTRGIKNYVSLLTKVPEKILAAASFFIIRTSNPRINPVYITWYLNQPQSQYYFTQNSGSGVAMPVVRRNVLEQIDIPIPAIETQNRIAKLYYLMQDEEKLTIDLLKKRNMLTEAICLQAAEREKQ